MQAAMKELGICVMEVMARAALSYGGEGRQLGDVSCVRCSCDGEQERCNCRLLFKLLLQDRENKRCKLQRRGRENLQVVPLVSLGKIQF
jgi:hypothetical protein